MQHLQTNTLLQGGKYKIERVLGQGGFGITYLAEHTLLETTVAVKEFFLKDFCKRESDTSSVAIGIDSNKEFVERYRQKFLKEARMIYKLRHPNIVSIVDIFTENDTAYYVMDYIKGTSLNDMILKEGALPESTAIGYIKEVARALGYIHEQKVNHLDIKPANIMVKADGKGVILIDFGLSKQYDVETGSQTSTTPVGISHGYAPMEQYRQGGVSEFSPQTDIYSLGATLYKMVTGLTPPEASILLDEDEELTRTPGISDTTWNAIKKAMIPSRKKRIASVDEFMSLLNCSAEKSASEKTVVSMISQQKNISEETIIAPPKDEDGTMLFATYHQTPESVNARKRNNIVSEDFFIRGTERVVSEEDKRNAMKSNSKRRSDIADEDFFITGSNR